VYYYNDTNTPGALWDVDPLFASTVIPATRTIMRATADTFLRLNAASPARRAASNGSDLGGYQTSGGLPGTAGYHFTK